MYRFPSEEAKQELRTKYERLQEYMVAYNAINVVSERYEDLSPEEIWDEALSIVEEIRKVPHKKWKVQHVYSQLKRKYSAFEREDGTIIERTDKQQSITATLVLFDVVCMLSLAQKLEPEQAQQHPYFEHLKTILSFFCLDRIPFYARHHLRVIERDAVLVQRERLPFRRQRDRLVRRRKQRHRRTVRRANSLGQFVIELRPDARDLLRNNVGHGGSGFDAVCSGNRLDSRLYEIALRSRDRTGIIEPKRIQRDRTAMWQSHVVAGIVTEKNRIARSDRISWRCVECRRPGHGTYHRLIAASTNDEAFFVERMQRLF